jgi:hypothetical protein
MNTMSETKRKEGLGIIFAFFLGLMVTALVGVGVYTFYSPPERETKLLSELAVQMEEIRDSRAGSELSEEEKAQLSALSAQRDELQVAFNQTQQTWIRMSGILLVVLATLTMAISLVAAERLSIISNGLLLGGVFTMLYGVGWSLFSTSTITRFIVIAIAFAITIALGYIRFVRQREAAVTPSRGQSTDDVGLASLEQRVSALESRINEAAVVLGRHD